MFFLPQHNKENQHSLIILELKLNRIWEFSVSVTFKANRFASQPAE
jgi:hypothetical protein